MKAIHYNNHSPSSNEVIKLALFPLMELIMFTTLSMITFQ